MTRPAGGTADSAGVPWEGRSFRPNPAAGDDGSADAALADALARFTDGDAGLEVVVDALRTARVLVPLLAEAGTVATGADGLRIDHSQELALVEVEAPDGRRALPAFSSVDTMRAWNPIARPVPADARRVALAAAGEGTELVVLDPGSSTAVVLRRSALRALATGGSWSAPADDPRTSAALEAAATGSPEVLAIRPLPGDPAARLAGPEVVVAVVLARGLASERRHRVLDALARRWSADPELAELTDSLAVRVVDDP